MSALTQQLINGLAIGCIYALISVGYTMVYGILELINFAFGEMFMFGAYITLMLTSTSISLFGTEVSMPGWNFFLALLIAIIVIGFVGMTIERVAYRPLRTAPRLAPLISAIGVSILLQNLGQTIFGSKQVPFPSIPLFSAADGSTKSFTIMGARITWILAFVVMVTIAAMVLLHLFVRRTRMGKAMRASAQDQRTSALMGINVNRVIALTFFIGSAMGALGGALYASVYQFALPTMGFFPGIKALIAAVLGGIGNIVGAFVGALCLGMVEALAAAYLPMGSQYRDAIAFLALIAILLIKPSGLLGSQVAQKA